MVLRLCGLASRPAARELNVPIPDLRRLIWSKLKLLEEAELERIARAMGVGWPAIIRWLRRGGSRWLKLSDQHQAEIKELIHV